MDCRDVLLDRVTPELRRWQMELHGGIAQVC